MIVWAAHFGLIYMANAIACERALAAEELHGLPLVPLLVGGLTLVALLLVGVIGLRAWQRLPHGLSGQEGEDDPHFLAWFTVAVALLSALAIVWEAVPAFILQPCG